MRARTGPAHATPQNPRRMLHRIRILPVFAALTSFAFVSVAAVPHASSLTVEEGAAAPSSLGTQAFIAVHEDLTSTDRDEYGVTKPKPKPPRIAAAPASGRPDPGSAKAIAFDMVAQRGWGQGEYDCLVALWNRESGWNVYAHNRSSGAYGIPQALPGSKMASAGADWRTNPHTQISWGLGYISGRYGTPCGAWASSQSRGWY